jgi:hypothetical protein
MTRRRTPTIKSILFADHIDATRLLLAMGSFTWAILLAWPGDLFTPARTTYKLMAVVAPELFWALAFLVHGVWAIYTLTTGCRNRASLIMDAFLGCVLWTSSTLLCFAAHWPHGITTGVLDQIMQYPMPAAMSGELWMSIASWWCFVRHWAEKK